MFRKIPQQIVLLIALNFFIFGAMLLNKTIFSTYFIMISLATILISEFSIIERRDRFFQWVVLIAAFLSILLPLLAKTPYVYPVYVFIITVFFYTVILLLLQITKERKVSTVLIIDAISGFLLLGVVLVLLNELAFIFDAHALGETVGNLANVTYYSFSTLTTIGYGDISPTSDFAKAVSVFGGIVGQLYLTIVIAFIVGKFTASKKSKD